MRLRAVALLVLLGLFFSLSLSGCAHQNPSASARLSAMLDEAHPLPSGALYRLFAAEDEEGYASPELLASLFGEGSEPVALDAVEEGAFYLSFTQPYEVGVFLCKSAGRTREVSEMCLRRLSHLQAYFSTRGEHYPKGCVRVFGRWVVVCFCEDPDAALQAFRRTQG